MSRSITDLYKAVEDHELEGMDIISAYKTEELEGIYNGIGPDRFPEWLREIVTGSAGLFEPAALIHDVEYHIGGTYEDFTEANERFKRNCEKLVKDKYGWYNPLRYAWLNKARRWANYCQIFGWFGYNKKET